MTDGGGVRVLLADDDVDVRSALADLLASDSRVGVIGVAAEGAGALRYAEAERPHVAVVDVRMPDGGGELVRRLAGMGIAVICFSADAASRTAMLQAGASCFIAKGDRIPDLVELILSAVPQPD